MKLTPRFIKLILGASLAAGLFGCSSSNESSNTGAQPNTQPPPQLAAGKGVDDAGQPLTAEDSVLVSITATVTAIDAAKREMTLKGPLGNEVPLTVDKRVKRLDEIKVGDDITADYFVSVAGELRAPTDAEREHPITILEGAARAPKGVDPAAGAVRAVKIVATVDGLDLPTRTVTLKGPMGNCATVRARKLENLKKLRLGDTIVVTYTEALAVSVEKAKHPAKPE